MHSKIHEFLRSSYAEPSKRRRTIDGYQYNPDYSDAEVAVYTRDGKAVFVARGSKPNLFHSDWSGKRGNIANEFGYDIRESEQYANLSGKRQKLEHDGYGDIVAVGHSRGGALVDELNQDKRFSHVFDVNSPTFWANHERAENQTSIRSALDPASALNPRSVSQKRSWNDVIQAAKSLDPSYVGIAQTAKYYLGQHDYESIDFDEYNDLDQYFHGPDGVELDPTKLESALSSVVNKLHNFSSLDMPTMMMKKRARGTFGRSQHVSAKSIAANIVPTRSVKNDYSFQMSASAGMKQNCFNVFRHQELEVLTTKSINPPLPSTTGLNVAAAFDGHTGIVNPGFGSLGAVGVATTLQPYVLRGYGHNNIRDPANNNTQTVYIGQSHVGPKYTDGGSFTDVNQYNVGWGSLSFGGTQPLSMTANPDDCVGGTAVSVDRASRLHPVTTYPIPRLTGISGDTLNSGGQLTTKIGQPGYDTGVILPEHVMALCPTMWSPICQQSLEVAAANLAGTTQQGTIAGHQGIIAASTGVHTDVQFNIDNLVDGGKQHPRNRVDPFAAKMCVNDHSCNYSFANQGTDKYQKTCT